MQIGNTTEGGYGLGWDNPTADTSDLVLDDTIVQQEALEVLDDKIEESEDKEMILGDEVLNPTTGRRVLPGGPIPRAGGWSR